MSSQACEKLIQLASYESGSFINPKNSEISTDTCHNMCTKLYEFAKEDGHNIMNTSKYTCTCETQAENK